MPRFAKSFKRLVALSLQNLSRNLSLSAATIVMMGLILFIFNIIIALNGLTQGSLDELNKKVDLILYVDDSASIYEITEMINDLKTLSYVTDVSYTSKDDALKEFLSTYPDEENPFSTYGIENPLPQSIRVVTTDPNKHADVTAYLDSTPYEALIKSTESMSENQEITARLLSVTSFTKKLIAGVIVTFILCTILMVMNAINLSIFTRKTEIKIMQLVGAKPGTIFLPFIFEGAFYGIASTLFSLFLLIFFLQGTGILSHLSPDTFNIILFIPLELLCAAIIGILASYLSVHFYLKQHLILEDS